MQHIFVAPNDRPTHNCTWETMSNEYVSIKTMMQTDNFCVLICVAAKDIHIRIHRRTRAYIAIERKKCNNFHPLNFWRESSTKRLWNVMSHWKPNERDNQRKLYSTYKRSLTRTAHSAPRTYSNHIVQLSFYTKKKQYQSFSSLGRRERASLNQFTVVRFHHTHPDSGYVRNVMMLNFAAAIDSIAHSGTAPEDSQAQMGRMIWCTSQKNACSSLDVFELMKTNNSYLFVAMPACRAISALTQILRLCTCALVHTVEAVQYAFNDTLPCLHQLTIRDFVCTCGCDWLFTAQQSLSKATLNQFAHDTRTAHFSAVKFDELVAFDSPFFLREFLH